VVETCAGNREGEVSGGTASSPRGRRRRTRRSAVSGGVSGFKPPTESTPVMCGAPGERWPPTGGPRPGIEEADRWDPSTDIF
jgi:hypothetical protein